MRKTASVQCWKTSYAGSCENIREGGCVTLKQLCHVRKHILMLMLAVICKCKIRAHALAAGKAMCWLAKGQDANCSHPHADPAV